MKVMCVIIGQQYFSFFHFQYNDAIMFDKTVKIYEGQQFESIWQNTLDTQVSDGILLFNF